LRCVSVHLFGTFSWFIFWIIEAFRNLNFTCLIDRSSSNPQRHKSIECSHHRETPSQSGRLWVCEIDHRMFWCYSHFYSSQRNNRLLGSWILEDISTHWKEWCLLFRCASCWTDDRKTPDWTKEIVKRESHHKMGKNWSIPGYFIFRYDKLWINTWISVHIANILSPRI